MAVILFREYAFSVNVKLTKKVEKPKVDTFKTWLETKPYWEQYLWQLHIEKGSQSSTVITVPASLELAGFSAMRVFREILGRYC